MNRGTGGWGRKNGEEEEEEEEEEEDERTLTIITAPVDVDAATVVTGELSEGEAGRVGCKNIQHC